MEEQGREFVTPEIDKRQQRRAKLITQVTCDALSRDEVLVTRDISAGGLFITTKNPLPLDSVVRLTFSLGAGHPNTLCAGRVVYSQKGMGMGIQFADLSETDRESLEKFVDEVI
jgi:hypothetical protein